jgi:RHS repeat-associated protein
MDSSLAIESTGSVHITRASSEQYDGTDRFVLTYNVRNEFTGWTATNNSGVVTSTLSIVYDALGRRISKTYKGLTTNYVNSGEQVIEETVGGTARRHLVGLGLDEVYATRSTTGSTVSEEYLLHDALNNSVGAAVDAASKNVKTGYGYTPFSKGFATHSAATQNPILFAGAEANESGSVIHYLRGRYYSATLGRFLTEDPIGLAGGDTNLYRYVSNRPHVDYDPTGLGSGVPTFSVGISEGFVSPFVESFALGPGDLFVLQATLQSGVGATATRGYLGTPEDVSVNPVGGVPGDLVAQAESFGSYRGEGACGNAAFAAVNCAIYNVPNFSNLDLTARGIRNFLQSNQGRLNQKLGAKIGEGRLPFPLGKAGRDAAVEVVRRTLQQPTDVYGLVLTDRGKNLVVNVYSRVTAPTVRIPECVKKFETTRG